MPKGAYSKKGHTLMGETKHLVSPLARLILAKMRSRSRSVGSSSSSTKAVGSSSGSSSTKASSHKSHKVGRKASRKVGSRPHKVSRKVGSQRVGSRSHRVSGSRRVGSRSHRVRGSRRVVGSRRVRVVGSRPMPGFAGPGSRRVELGPRVLTGSQKMLLARLHKARAVSHAKSAQFGGRACRSLSGCVKSRSVGIRRRRDKAGHLRLRNYAHEGKGISNAVGRLALGFAVSHPRVARRSLKGPGRAFRGGKSTLLHKTVNTVASTATSAANKVVSTGKGLLGMKGGARRGSRKGSRKGSRRVHRGGDCVGAPIEYSMSASS